MKYELGRFSCQYVFLTRWNNYLLYEAEQVGEESIGRGEERQADRQQLPTDGNGWWLIIDDEDGDGDDEIDNYPRRRLSLRGFSEHCLQSWM